MPLGVSHWIRQLQAGSIACGVFFMIRPARSWISKSWMPTRLLVGGRNAAFTEKVQCNMSKKRKNGVKAQLYADLFIVGFLCSGSGWSRTMVTFSLFLKKEPQISPRMNEPLWLELSCLCKQLIHLVLQFFFNGGIFKCLLISWHICQILSQIIFTKMKSICKIKLNLTKLLANIF